MTDSDHETERSLVPGPGHVRFCLFRWIRHRCAQGTHDNEGSDHHKRRYHHGHTHHKRRYHHGHTHHKRRYHHKRGAYWSHGDLHA